MAPADVEHAAPVPADSQQDSKQQPLQVAFDISATLPQTAPQTEAPTTTVTSKTEEEFDEDGNPLRVANLEFIEGILGKGAYGTVRLARRRVPPPDPPDSEATSPPNTGTPDRHTRRRNRRRAKGDGFYRSASAPGSTAFFTGRHGANMTNSGSLARSSDDTEITSGTRFRRRNSHNVADETSEEDDSTLKLFSPTGFVRRASSTISSLFDDDHRSDANPTYNELVAVKICSKSILKRMRTMERDSVTHKVKVRTALEKVEREIALMKKMRHPNLVTLFEVIDSPNTNMLYMVLEYMPLGEILTYQDNGTFRRRPRKDGKPKLEGVNERGYFDEVHSALYFVDILHALAYLHMHHICHRDLKPENILLDARGTVKITDFGVSYFFKEEHGFGTLPISDSASGSSRHGSSDEDASASSTNDQQPSGEFCFKQYQRLTRSETDSALKMTGMHNAGLLTKTEGTWCFWSPEMCSSGSSAFSGYAADLWAAGVCLYIFATGRLPFYSDIPTDLFDMIAQAQVPYEGLGLSNSLIDLLKATLAKDPAKRAGVGDCLQHPFLQVAREKRIRQLSAELERSGKRQLVVGEDEIRRAFRIVNIPNPAALLMTAKKQLKETYQAARDRMSSLYSQSSHSSLDQQEDTPPSSRHHSLSHPFILTKKHSTLSSCSSTASDTGRSSDRVLPKTLFTIPHDRKITDSMKSDASMMSCDSEPKSTDGIPNEELESATASPIATMSPPSSPTSSSKRSKAKKGVNRKTKTKRRKGGCVLQ